MLNNVRDILYCTCLILVIRSFVGSWDIWPFNQNKITTPTINIIPETDNNFIYYNYDDEIRIQSYIDSINPFLNSYKKFDEENSRNCDFNNPPPENSACVFDTRNLGICSEFKDFGYSRSSPCIYFTLSKVQNWIPNVLNISNIQRHSDQFFNIPDHLNATITYAEKRNSVEKYVWLTCEGDTAADKEFIGPISYYPHKGFPVYYFPFTNVVGYQSPIVAIHFERPMRGVAITIECTARAQNIELNREDGIGYIKFHLLVD